MAAAAIVQELVVDKCPVVMVMEQHPIVLTAREPPWAAVPPGRW